MFAITANCYQTKYYRFSVRERIAMKLLRSTQENNKCSQAAHPGKTPWFAQSTTQLPRWRTERRGDIKSLRSWGKGWRQRCSEQFRASRARITKAVSLTSDNKNNLKVGKVFLAYEIGN